MKRPGNIEDQLTYLKFFLKQLVQAEKKFTEAQNRASVKGANDNDNGDEGSGGTREMKSLKKEVRVTVFYPTMKVVTHFIINFLL